MVFTCLALSVFSTIKEYEEDAVYILFRMEILVVIWFTMEFGARLWSSGCRSRYQGCLGRMKFVKRPFCIIGKLTLPLKGFKELKCISMFQISSPF